MSTVPVSKVATAMINEAERFHATGGVAASERVKVRSMKDIQQFNEEN
jgi:hypothetical protein